jgi:hypothetical protein
MNGPDARGTVPVGGPASAGQGNAALTGRLKAAPRDPSSDQRGCIVPAAPIECTSRG